MLLLGKVGRSSSPSLFDNKVMKLVVAIKADVFLHALYTLFKPF